MKIRNGFVSNSSSSSFIVVFPREPKNAEDVKNMVFTKGETLYYSTYDDDHWTTDHVANTIWSDINSQVKNDFKTTKEILSNQYGNDSPRYDDFKHISDDHERWTAYEAATNRYAEKQLNEFFNMRKLKLKILNKETIVGAVIYCFEFSDDSTYGSALEHGDLFHNMKHIKISNH